MKLNTGIPAWLFLNTHLHAHRHAEIHTNIQIRFLNSIWSFPCLVQKLEFHCKCIALLAYHASLCDERVFSPYPYIKLPKFYLQTLSAAQHWVESVHLLRPHLLCGFWFLMKSNQIPTDGLHLNIKCINLAPAKSVVERGRNGNQVWWHCDSVQALHHLET